MAAKALAYLVTLVVIAATIVVALASDWTWIAAFLNGAWPPWVSNVAHLVQIASLAIALLAVWLATVVRSQGTEPGVDGTNPIGKVFKRVDSGKEHDLRFFFSSTVST